MSSKKEDLDIKNPVENKEDVKPANEQVSDVIDIQITEVPKKRFRVNGDNSRILLLNVSDVNIGIRLKKGYEELAKIMNEISNIPDTEDFGVVADALEKANDAMCKQLDYIFDSNVSEVCGAGGNMYDPYNGMFRYENILDSLTKLYTANLNDEYRKMRKRLSKHTDKYLK